MDETPIQIGSEHPDILGGARILTFGIVCCAGAMALVLVVALSAI